MMKDFITNQIEKCSALFTEEQFMGLSKTENSLIIIEIPLADYALTDIARIVENNNARVMNLFVLPISDGNTLLISIKLNVEDIAPVMRGFERFDYTILYYKMREGSITDTHKNRLNELLYYLEM